MDSNWSVLKESVLEHRYHLMVWVSPYTTSENTVRISIGGLVVCRGVYVCFTCCFGGWLSFR